jgi:DNA mismatch endonuclease (patch repair protein)
MPTSNTEYWLPKLDRNCERDKENRAALKKLGWSSVVVWECEIHGTVEKVIAKLVKFLSPKN